MSAGGSSLPRLALLTCEHASNAVPAGVALGVAPEVVDSHVGWDPGALPLARGLRDRFAVPLIEGRTSRLVVDLNRDPDGPWVVPVAAFGVPIPGNAAATALDRADRIATWHRPFRDAVLAAARAAADRHPLLHLSVHSFTPRLERDGRVEVRDYPLGVLFDPARPLEATVAAQLVAHLRAQGWDARANQPYVGTGEGTTTWLRTVFPSDRYAGIELEWNHGGSDDARRDATDAVAAALAPFALPPG